MSSAILCMCVDAPLWCTKAKHSPVYEEKLRIRLWSPTPPQILLGALQCTQKHPEKSQRHEFPHMSWYVMNWIYKYRIGLAFFDAGFGCCLNVTVPGCLLQYSMHSPGCMFYSVCSKESVSWCLFQDVCSRLNSQGCLFHSVTLCSKVLTKGCAIGCLFQNAFIKVSAPRCLAQDFCSMVTASMWLSQGVCSRVSASGCMFHSRVYPPGWAPWWLLKCVNSKVTVPGCRLWDICSKVCSRVYPTGCLFEGVGRDSVPDCIRQGVYFKVTFPRWMFQCVFSGCNLQGVCSRPYAPRC